MSYFFDQEKRLSVERWVIRAAQRAGLWAEGMAATPSSNKIKNAKNARRSISIIITANLRIEPIGSYVVLLPRVQMVLI